MPFCIVAAHGQSAAPLNEPPKEYNASMKESWLEWQVYSTLGNTLVPAYIHPEEEAQVQKWIGQLTHNKEEFQEANEHVRNMDRATRARDIKTVNEEAKTAHDILTRIKLSASEQHTDTFAANSSRNNSEPPFAPQRSYMGSPAGGGVLNTTTPWYRPSSREPNAPSVIAPPASSPAAQNLTWAKVPDVIQGESGKQFPSPEATLQSWGKAVLHSTTTGNKEYAALIYRRANGTWGYTPAQVGDESSSHPESQLPKALSDGALSSWTIHSHGSADDPLYGKNSERFSSHGSFGLGGDEGKSARNGQTQFLLTPSGHIKQLIPTMFGNLSGQRGTTVDLGNVLAGPIKKPVNL